MSWASCCGSRPPMENPMTSQQQQQQAAAAAGLPTGGQAGAAAAGRHRGRSRTTLVGLRLWFLGVVGFEGFKVWGYVNFHACRLCSRVHSLHVLDNTPTCSTPPPNTHTFASSPNHLPHPTGAEAEKALHIMQQRSRCFVLPEQSTS